MCRCAGRSQPGWADSCSSAIPEGLLWDDWDHQNPLHVLSSSNSHGGCRGRGTENQERLQTHIICFFKPLGTFHLRDPVTRLSSEGRWGNGLRLCLKCVQSHVAEGTDTRWVKNGSQRCNQSTARVSDNYYGMSEHFLCARLYSEHLT